MYIYTYINVITKNEIREHVQYIVDKCIFVFCDNCNEISVYYDKNIMKW